MTLTLSDDQLSAMRRQMDGYYCLPKLVDHMRSNYSHEPMIAGLSDAELTESVRRCLHDAWDLRLFSETDVFTFATFDLVYIPGFGRHPQIRRYLKSPGISPDTRMLYLCRKLSAADWKQIKIECELFAAEFADQENFTRRVL